MAAIFSFLHILTVKNVTSWVWCNNSYSIIFVITVRGGTQNVRKLREEPQYPDHKAKNT